MKKNSFIAIFILFALGCQKEPIPQKPTQLVKDGVIVWQTPLWAVPHDTAYYITTIFEPYYEFNGKVIVDTYKNKQGGIRCMSVETGEIFWEKYYDTSLNILGGQSFIIQDSFFNPDKGYLIIMIGLWGERKHVKIDIHTGETLWEIPLETFLGIDHYGDHYYCTVLSSGDVHPIYRVDIETGQAELFYATDLPPHPEYNAQRGSGALPFEYEGSEMLFIAQVQMTSPSSSNNYYCLIDAETEERLLKHIPIDSFINKVEVRDGVIYLFTGKGYKIFDMETLTIEREVKLVDSGEYVYHRFYKDKLIVGITSSNTIDKNGHYVMDLNTHTLLYIFDAWIYPSAILDDIIYFPSTGSTKFNAYNLTSGKKVLYFDLSYETQFGVATYQNNEGKKFVIVGDIGFTYCYEAI